VGNSSGGGLALGSLLLLRDGGSTPLPSASVLISPWVDLRMTAPSYRRFAGYGHGRARGSGSPAVSRHHATRHPGSIFGRSVDMTEHESLLHFRDLYLQGRPLDTINCPLQADLRRLPPTLVLAGEVELFIDDIRGAA